MYTFASLPTLVAYRKTLSARHRRQRMLQRGLNEEQSSFARLLQQVGRCSFGLCSGVLSHYLFHYLFSILCYCSGDVVVILCSVNHIDHLVYRPSAVCVTTTDFLPSLAGFFEPKSSPVRFIEDHYSLFQQGFYPNNNLVCKLW